MLFTSYSTFDNCHTVFPFYAFHSQRELAIVKGWLSTYNTCTYNISSNGDPNLLQDPSSMLKCQWCHLSLNFHSIINCTLFTHIHSIYMCWYYFSTRFKHLQLTLIDKLTSVLFSVYLANSFYDFLGLAHIHFVVIIHV